MIISFVIKENHDYQLSSQRKYCEQMEGFDRFSASINFFETANNQGVKKVKVLDELGSEFYVYYQNEQETISRLYQYYQEKAKKGPGYVFAVEKSGNRLEIAEPSQTIRFYIYGKNPEEVVFRVVKESEYKMKESAAMSIRVIIQAKGQDPFQLQISNKLNVVVLKEIVAKRLNIENIKEIKLVCSGKQLDNELRIDKYGIKSEDIIHVIMAYTSQTMNLFVKFISEQDKIIKINFAPTMLIVDVKKIIEQTEGIKKETINLLFMGKKLNDSLSIIDYNISKGSTLFALIVQTSMDQTIFVSKIKKKKKILLKLNEKQKVELLYHEERDKTVLDLVKEYAPNCNGYYCLLFDNILIEPHEKLSTIQQSPNFDSTHELQVQLNSSGVKYLFGKQLTNQGFNRTSFPLTQSNRSKVQQKFLQLESKNITLLSAITFFSTDAYSLELKDYVTHFLDSDMKQSKMQHFCSQIINEMQTLPKHRDFVYKGMKNFKFSSHYKEGDLFNESGFMSCNIKEESAKNYIDQGDTILKIRSMTGRNIKDYSVTREDEVLFVPYTYFSVQKIIRTQSYELVEVVELHSPLWFKDNIILWVDDEPQNNKTAISKLQEIMSSIEILEVISTKDAELWVKQFGWFMNWKDIKYKIISDMKRFEIDKYNFHAGADLIELLFNHYGITTPIMIFCNRVDSTQQNLAERGIIKDRVHQVTDNFHNVMDFATQFD